MGTVFEGVHTHIEKRVAVKVLAPAMARDANHRARFLNEARAAARITNPHVVSITDYGEQPVTFVVMEFLEGEDLAHRLVKSGPLGASEVLALLRQVCAGLEAAHKKGVVHRDVKPSNIFLAKDDDDAHEVVKILDFGIAKVFHADRSSKGITRPNEAVGTATYMAPEQVLGATVDPRTDLYSLGVVLFRMLVGRVPFRAENSFGLMEKHVRAAPPPLDVGLPGVEAVVLRCLEKDRDNRYPSAAALLRAFADAVQRDTAPPGPPSRSGRTLVPTSPVRTEVTLHPDALPLDAPHPLTSTEPVLVPIEGEPSLQDDSTLRSSSASVPPNPPATSRVRSGRLTMPLVLMGSIALGGIASAWHFSADREHIAPDELRAAALAAPTAEPHSAEHIAPNSQSEDDVLPAATGHVQDVSVPEHSLSAPNEADSGVSTPAKRLPVEETPAVLPTTDIDTPTDPNAAPRTRVRNARHKRGSRAKGAARADDPKPNVVVGAMLEDARKAALTNQRLCYDLAAEAHALHASQQAAVIMTKCACLLRSPEKASESAKLLVGDHPKLERLCELKGIDLAIE